MRRVLVMNWLKTWRALRSGTQAQSLFQQLFSLSALILFLCLLKSALRRPARWRTPAAAEISCQTPSRVLLASTGIKWRFIPKCFASISKLSYNHCQLSARCEWYNDWCDSIKVWVLFNTLAVGVTHQVGIFRNHDMVFHLRSHDDVSLANEALLARPVRIAVWYSCVRLLLYVAWEKPSTELGVSQSRLDRGVEGLDAGQIVAYSRLSKDSGKEN